MKLEFLGDISEGGKFKSVISDNLVRLYDFTEEETDKLTGLINTVLIEKGEELNLAKVDFITAINCELTLTIADDYIGIARLSSSLFKGTFTKENYQEMIEMMEAVTHGHNWLDEYGPIGIDFLYSMGGTW
jgi:hypothetical protein